MLWFYFMNLFNDLPLLVSEIYLCGCVLLSFILHDVLLPRYNCSLFYSLCIIHAVSSGADCVNE